MNYYLEKHDMEMILDALECLSEHLKHYENNSPNYPWTADEIDGLFQSIDNSSSYHDEKHGDYHYLNLSVVMRNCKDLEDAKKKCSDLMVQYPDENTQYMESWEIL